MNRVGRKIREVRQLKGLSQEELADAAGVNLRTIQRIENNENDPRAATLNLICKILDLTPEDILDYGKQIDKAYLSLFHLSVLTFLVIPVGNIIIPLILYMTKKDKIIGLKDIGANVLNFQILWSVFAYCSITLFAIFKIMHYANHSIFLYIFIGLYILNIILPIVSSVCITKGKTEPFYPKIIPLIK
jgi:transcriptional regulator with XRE-family HTH domain